MTHGPAPRTGDLDDVTNLLLAGLGVLIAAAAVLRAGASAALTGHVLCRPQRGRPRTGDAPP